MPKGYPSLSEEQKQEIIKRIKEKGERVPDLAKEYGIAPKIIYNLLRRTAQGPGALLELAKLKRENDALLRIIGQLTAQEKLGKKMRYGGSH
ncbi:MAG: helix-turn-helix domain-containing protein [Candidatus Azambacteria bacterium]|nr:helix-turn-helix domain-containing protein [Candidatus Azambacteria bacterium]